jgi:hypothetical protein
MVVAKLAGAVLGAGMLVVLTQVPAHAEVITPPNTCQATAAFQTGVDGPFTVDTQQLQPSAVIEVPLEDNVAWTARVLNQSPAPREVSGSLTVDLPWPLGTYTIESWSGMTDVVEKSGLTDYHLPAATPRGVELQVKGAHRENGQLVCSGTVNVKIAGSPFKSPATLVSLAGLAASGVALFLAGRPKLVRI